MHIQQNWPQLAWNMQEEQGEESTADQPISHAWRSYEDEEEALKTAQALSFAIV